MTEQKSLFLDTDFEEVQITPKPVTCLGMTFESDEARRAYFREELRKKLPELRKIEGFPIGEDDDISSTSPILHIIQLARTRGSMILLNCGRRRRLS